MKFNSTTSNDGILQDCETLTGLGKDGISDDTDKKNEFTRLINIWYRTADTWMWKAIGDWEFDDSGYSTLPIATTDLVDSQEDYSLPSTARKIDRVEVLDNNSNFQLLTPIDKSEITVDAMTEFEETDGLPAYYDVVGNSLILYPAPATAKVTLTNGLKLYCSRDIVEFSSSATTREPGFDNHFHRVLSLGASYDWCISRGLVKANFLKLELNKIENDLTEHFGSRHRNYKTRLRITDETSY